MPSLIDAVHQSLDRRLATHCDHPIALALSGGGDSVALAHIAKGWAQTHGRRLLCLTVDHGLNPASLAWTAACGDLAAQLGADFQALTWTGPKPVTGIPAAARAARHTLLADAARSAGASVILMGHTASDLSESAAMRLEGSSTPDAREWSPSPIWPQGRSLFLLRPMLGIGRSELRAWLSQQGMSWIDDPANDDLRFARSRARRSPQATQPPGQALPPLLPRELALMVEEDFGLRTPRMALLSAEPSAATALVGIACVCAGGGARLPDRKRLVRLTEALRSDRPIAMTLSGAQVLADRDTIRWVRTAGEVRRSRSEDLHLAAGNVGVWDGRYEVTAQAPISVRALAGHRADLSRSARRQLAHIPASARGALPFFAGETALNAPPEIHLVSLVLSRFQAAAGLIQREPSAD